MHDPPLNVRVISPVGRAVGRLPPFRDLRYLSIGTLGNEAKSSENKRTYRRRDCGAAFSQAVNIARLRLADFADLRSTCV